MGHEIDFAELAGFNTADPAVLAAEEDFDELANIIDTLVAHRKATGITQQQVAETMGTKQSVVSNIERIGGNPTIRTLQAYARAVGLRLRLLATPETVSHTRQEPLSIAL
jgi:transcriptional regulator with XRE-family HTH domain